MPALSEPRVTFQPREVSLINEAIERITDDDLRVRLLSMWEITNLTVSTVGFTHAQLQATRIALRPVVDRAFTQKDQDVTRMCRQAMLLCTQGLECFPLKTRKRA